LGSHLTLSSPQGVSNYNGYKFRADYSGTQTYSNPLLVTADLNNPVAIAVGGSAGRLLPNSSSPLRGEDRGGGDEVQVASLFMLPGMLAGLTNSAIADSNGENLYFYHSDHLGTPLFLTDVDGVVVWRGEYLPFGEVFSEDRDPDGDGVEVDQSFRLPGQYEDEETGLYYNYFRDYDSQIGRYVEADPIGLSGGVNVWGYVGQNPVNWVDVIGLYWEYSQSTGNLTYVDDYNNNRTPTDEGYSGTGAGLNNPDRQDERNIGPVPRGMYTIGPQENYIVDRDPDRIENDNYTLWGSMPLIPDSDTELHGRSGFMIHGDNQAGNNTASQGCPVFGPKTRNRITNSGDNRLRVVR